MKENILKNISFQVAIEVVTLCNDLKKQHSDFVISKQLCRSGTSIGALIRESEYSESRADFIHKLSIALKESNETLYLLEIIMKIYPEVSSSRLIIDSVTSVIKILTSRINTSKKTLNKLKTK